MKKLKSSIDHFTGREQQALHGICKHLKEALQPLLVLYLGSLATTTLRRNLSSIEKNAMDFRLSRELLVVLPEGAPLLSDRAGLRLLEQSLSPHAHVRLMLQTPEGLVRQLSSGRDARVNLHSQAIVLYERAHTLQKIIQRVADAAVRPTSVHTPAKTSVATAPEAGVGDIASAFPVRLSAEERADPLSVVVGFYRLYDLPEVRMRISSWMESVVGSPVWPVAETGLHLDFYVSLCRLLESACLLRGHRPPPRIAQQLEASVGMTLPPQSLYCPHDGVDAWDYFPNHLSRAELSAPGEVFTGLFTDRSLSVWLEELYRLFSYSLTDCTPALIGEVWDLSGLTTRLHRLAEACHLLSVWERRAGGASAVLISVPPSGHPPAARLAICL